MSRPIRVFVGSLVQGERQLEPAAARYLTQVHRLGPGDAFVAFDPEACCEADAVLTEVGARHASARLSAVRAAEAASLPITLVQALGKGNRVDYVVREATALGVARLIVASTERSVPKGGERARARRWLTIAIEAARQSGRGDVPSIQGPLDLDDALAFLPAGRKLCLDPTAPTVFDSAIRELGAEEQVIVLIGPEGGLTPREMAAAEAAGFLRVGFGRLILRTETAAVAVLGALVARMTAR